MQPIPVTTVGGYLGAGKTTLINALLRDAGGRRLAILVNEFGALPIDQDLIEAQEGNLMSIAGGCICCSFGNDLIGALGDLCALDPPPDHILIEASGVAIPSSIAANMALLPSCLRNGVVVLADAETVRQTARDKYLGDTIARQLFDADLVLLTKSDLVDATQVDAVREWLAAMAPEAQVVSAPHGRAPLDLVLGPVAPRSHTAEAHHADTLFESVVLPVTHAVDVPALAQTLASPELALVRAKGFVKDDAGQTHAIQVVSRRWEVLEAPAPESHALVCIAIKGQLDTPALQRTLTACDRRTNEVRS